MKKKAQPKDKATAKDKKLKFLREVVRDRLDQVQGGRFCGDSDNSCIQPTH